MSFSSTTALLPLLDKPDVSEKIIAEIENKLNCIFKAKSHLLHALGAAEPSFWTSARIWSNQAMLKSNHLDLSRESLLRAAKYLDLPVVISESSEEVSNDDLCQTVKSILVSVYMDCSDQRIMHRAANCIGLYFAFPFGEINLTQKQMETSSMVTAAVAKPGAALMRGGVANPGIFW